MPDRRVKVIFEAEVGGMKKGLSEAASATEKLAKATETAGKSVDERMQKINAVATADQRAAKAAGLLYNAQGQLADSNGKVLSSSQAAAHGVEAFSEAVYLSGHEAGVAAAATEAAAKKAAEAAEHQKAAWQTVAPVMMAAGAGMVAGVGLAVKKYADFDKSMSNVQAATHATTGDMNLLREAAMTAGADTAFSAEEAAGGIEQLAKAGVSTSEIMGGGLTGALSLAAAGELAVGDAAEIAATAMTQFNLSGDQIPHLADLLAAGAGKAQGSVADLGAALNQSGLVASAAGLNIEETTGTLAAFASSGLLGSDAGTSFKSMLQALQNPSKKASLEMERLGISLYDANGEFAGMDSLAGQLKTSLAGASSAERDKTMAIIFGSDAVRAANVLYAQGAEGIQEWTEKVNDAEYAAKTAAIMQDNLAGDLELLGGAFDTVFLKAGGTGNDVLRGFVQSAESVVDMVGKIPAPVLGVGTILAGVAGGALLLGGGLITAIPKIKDTVDALRDVAPAGGKADKALRGVGKGAAYAAGAMGALSIVGPGVASLMNSGATADATAMSDALFKVGDGGVAAGVGMADIQKMFTGSDKFWGLASSGIEDAFRVMGNPTTADNVDNIVSSVLSMGTKGSANIEFAKKNFAQLDAQIAAMVADGNAEEAANAYDQITQKAVEAGVPIEKLVEIFPGYNSALAANSTASTEAAAANEEVTAALEEVGLAADGAVADMEKFLEQLFSMGNATMDSRDAAFAYQEQIRSIAEAQKEIAKGEMGPALNKNKDDFNELTEAGKLANDEFQALARGGMDEIAKMSAEGLGQDELQGKLNTTYSDLVKAGEGFGLSKAAAADLAREVLQVPDGVDIKTWMDSEAKRLAEETKQGVEAIPGYASVAIAVSEDGTAGEVQSKVNAITGKTEYVFVTDDGTVVSVQQRIENVNGVERTVYVGDDGTVYSTQGKINSVKDGSATVNVSDGGTVSWIQGQINAIKGKTITIKSIYSGGRPPASGPGGQGGPTAAHGRRAPGLANGGRVPYTGLGTDKVMGINQDGVPHIRVDDREWVVNRKSSDKHDELINMINQDDPRVEQLKALIGLASGGRVGAAESKVKSTKRTYDQIDGKKANRLRKLAAKDQWEAAKEELASVKKSSKASADAAKKAAEARKKAAQEERERVARVNEEKFDLRRDLKRGNIRDSFTSGSGMSVVDQMFDQSKNMDLSKSKRSALSKKAYSMESSLLKLEKEAAKVEKALDKAIDKRDDLLAVQRQTQGSILGTFDLGELTGQKDAYGYDKAVSKKSILASGKAKAASAKKLRDKVAKLQKMGFKPDMIQSVIDEWTSDGTFEVADALITMSKKEVKSLNSAYAQTSKYGAQTGEYLTRSMYKGGEEAAQGVVNGLKSKSKKVDDAFYKMGKDAEKAFKKSLGINSPSTVLFGRGEDAGDGVVGGGLASIPKVEETFSAMGSAAENAFAPNLAVPMSAEVGRYAAQPSGATVSLSSADRQLIQDFIVASNNMPPMQLVANRQQLGTMAMIGNNYNRTHK